MKKLVLMFVFCLFNLVSYSQVITVHKRTMDYKVENYDSTALKLDTLKTIITSNLKIKWVNFFENGKFIDITTPEKLYDYLVGVKGENNG